ncbi:MAG: hypothetical protein ACOYXT_08135 [Bacteroidota bacterium]
MKHFIYFQKIIHTTLDLNNVNKYKRIAAGDWQNGIKICSSPHMRSTNDIYSRIQEINEDMEQLKIARKAEMKKPFFERRQRTMMFLYIEERKQEALLKQLKWVLNAER